MLLNIYAHPGKFLSPLPTPLIMFLLYLNDSSLDYKGEYQSQNCHSNLLSGQLPNIFHVAKFQFSKSKYWINVASDFPETGVFLLGHPFQSAGQVNSSHEASA